MSDTCYIQAAECRLRIRHIGQKNTRNPVAVFLHEGLGCIEMWRDFPEKVCESAGISGLIYERKGYGGSDKFRGRWHKDYLEHEARYLPEILDECGIATAILIGHSDGGSIALIAAALYPERISAIITEAAHIFVEDITLSGIRETVAAFKTTNLKEKLARYHQDNTETLFYRWADTWLAPDFRDWNIGHFLPKVRCSALILQGKEDEYATIAQVQGIVGQISGCVESELIPGCRHVPHHQAQQAVLQLMTAFIKKQLKSEFGQ